MVTLYGRSLAHEQLSAVELAFGNTSQDFWVRHEWINSILNQRMERFLLNYSTISMVADPMLLFAFMVVQASVLYLFKIMEPLGQLEQYKAKVGEYNKRALLAAWEIAHLGKEHAKTSYFKVNQYSVARSLLQACSFTRVRLMFSCP
jgi:hypothetical protein